MANAVLIPATMNTEKGREIPRTVQEGLKDRHKEEPS